MLELLLSMPRPLAGGLVVAVSVGSRPAGSASGHHRPDRGRRQRTERHGEPGPPAQRLVQQAHPFNVAAR